MANIKIIDLPTGSPESTSFVEATQVDELAESGRSTVKLALNALGNFVAGQGASPLEYGNLETESTTLIGAANELHNTIGADAYDDTATYNTGDYCIYGGELYKCNDDNVTGAWDAAKWDLTKVVDELGGGGGNADFVECTQAEYDAMEQAGTLDPTVMYFITDGQSGGGATELADLTDVDLTSPADGQLLRYNGTSGKWENIGVDSIGSNTLDTTDKTLVGAINELNAIYTVKNFQGNAPLNINDCVTGFVYWANSNAYTYQNLPATGAFHIITFKPITTHGFQMAIPNDGGRIWIRILANGIWGSWKYTGLT